MEPIAGWHDDEKKACTGVQSKRLQMHNRITPCHATREYCIGETETEWSPNSEDPRRPQPSDANHSRRGRTKQRNRRGRRPAASLTLTVQACMKLQSLANKVGLGGGLLCPETKMMLPTKTCTRSTRLIQSHTCRGAQLKNEAGTGASRPWRTLLPSFRASRRGRLALARPSRGPPFGSSPHTSKPKRFA